MISRLPPRGTNPLLYNGERCKRDGCFNDTIRARVEIFAECFPRAIGFTDIDYMVEIGGHGLIQEFKHPGEPLKDGQRKAFERLTEPCPQCGYVGRMMVFIVTAENRGQDVHAYTPIFGGKMRATKEANLDDLKERLRGWAAWADNMPFEK
jgi:hypothetical protein